MRTIVSLPIALSLFGCAGAQSPAVIATPIDVLAPLTVGSTTLDAGDVDAGSTIEPALAAEDLARRVEAMYTRAAPFTCAYRRDVPNSAGLHISASGKVSFERPGRLRIDEATTAMIVDRGRLIGVTPGLVTTFGVGVAHCPAFLAFASGEGRLARRLELQSYDGAMMNAQGMTILVGTPVPPTPMMTKVLFYVDTSTLEVRRALFVAGAERTRFDFEPLVKNTLLAPSLFTVTPAVGAVLTVSTSPPPLVPLLAALP